jgi:lipoate-protein ligase A
MYVRLISTPPLNGFRNMAIDEAILLNRMPTLRFYEWQPSCVSVGYFQNTLREVNSTYCHTHDIDIVRRPTGGKAVLHEYELTYSIVVPENLFGSQVIQSYRTISQVFVSALKKIDIPIQIRVKAEPAQRSPLCFQAVSFYELVCNGKKIMGSAQTRRNGMLLQHGSILLDVDYEKLYCCMNFQAPLAEPESLTHYLTGINRECSLSLSCHELKKIIADRFKKELHFTLKPATFTEEENLLARELENHKYIRREWNYKTIETPA